jgi:hypothetical protein
MSPTLKAAVDQIVFARNYSRKLLASVPATDWFRQPPGGISHIAWQVGHLTMAQYRLAIERMRGRQPGDERLVSETFLMHFGRDSVPDPDPAKNLSLEEIQHSFERVHEQVVHEVPRLTEEELDEPPLKPHPLFTTKLGSLVWCGQHEMLHAGQIGLLRRQLGHSPLW